MSPLPSTLIGDEGNDTLVGNAADDDLQGGAGNDRLTGAYGTNQIDPGTGNDVIDYSEQGPGGVGMLSDHVLYRFLSRATEPMTSEIPFPTLRRGRRSRSCSPPAMIRCSSRMSTPTGTSTRARQ